MECPSCGGPVTMEVGPNQSAGTAVADALLAAEEGEQIVVDRTCWACGWGEERTVSIDSIETTEGDAHTIERAALLKDIMREATAIDDLATLDAVLAPVRQKRQLDQSSTDTGEDITE